MEYSAASERSIETTPASAAETLPLDTARKDEGSVKETVEQILIAFILAFIFRAFVVEAFVIPTGSMAPTLLGAHMRFTCPDCGYQFDENYNANQSGDDIIMPVDNRAETPTPNRDRIVTCPSCGFALPSVEPTDLASHPFVRYGDRILVLKYLYLFNQPHRWDVVVFKAPVEQSKFDFSQNYIKRLVGRPNESVMVLDGDVYVGTNDSTPEQMVVQTKPREVQESLWRIVADSDFVPRKLPRTGAPWEQPWQMRSGQSGWTSPTDAGSGAPCSFHFDNLSSFAELFFKDTANVDSARSRNGGDRESTLKDWLAYDADVWPPRPYGDFNYVGDLKVQFYYQRKSGDGPLQVMLGKRGETFIAELTTDSVRLLHQDGKGRIDELIGATKTSLSAGSTHRVELSNVDYAISLLIDGKEILTTTPEQYHPDIAKLVGEQARGTEVAPPMAELRAGHQSCDVTHLSIWRDIYYISRGGRFNATANSPMRLGPDEYFVLGDNSQVSGDGRYWSEPIDLPYEHLKVDAGKVPGRFLLGKAFFVYWPAGYRPFDSWPAIAPDFGDMRLIH